MEAAWYEKRENSITACGLCPNNCVIRPGHSGVCRIRSNHDGVLMADGYGEVVSLSIDPIEKKPLYHFYPGAPILSTGPNGCNFRCGFCQNSDISQDIVPTRHLEPAELARIATRDDSIGIAYTYTEPFIWFEYIRDTGRLIHEQGQVNVLVTNGYVHEGPLRELLPLIDAMNIDVKSMNPDFYREICGGALNDVKRTVEIAAGSCHVEVTNLIITGKNDADDDFERLTDWLAGIDPATPLHFSRYFPRYQFTAPTTPAERIERACEIARTKLKYVYAGNIEIECGSDTLCPVCGNMLIRRAYYTIHYDGIKDGRCSSCSEPVEVIGC